MKLTSEEILDLWSNDAKINIDELELESIKSPKLHEKYYRMYLSEKKTLARLEKFRSEAYIKKYEYYSGKLTIEECKEIGLPPFGIKLTKQEITDYINGDPGMSKILLAMADQKEKVDMLESILRTIASRSYNIHNAIEFLKFTNGVGG